MKKAKKMRGGGATMSVSPRKKMAMGMMRGGAAKPKKMMRGGMAKKRG
mgnify:FL=1|jgi:hypothetical protein|tara:strand:+ start:267 stop:410 length:144 start_codon:yes stop_codon:yes gene_type:complete